MYDHSKSTRATSDTTIYDHSKSTRATSDTTIYDHSKSTQKEYICDNWLPFDNVPGG
jgi:hypothetical protein